MGLAQWKGHPPLMHEVQGSNPAPSENTTSIPHRISELSEGGGVKLKKVYKDKLYDMGIATFACCLHGSNT